MLGTDGVEKMNFCNHPRSNLAGRPGNKDYRCESQHPKDVFLETIRTKINIFRKYKMLIPAPGVVNKV